jgi:predicted metal-dependent HD superfamily phosphohydrolase
MSSLSANDLPLHWEDVLACFGVQPVTAQPAFHQLAERYAEPWRHYHTLDHIASMIDDLQKAAGAVSVPDMHSLVLAAYFHDVVYDPRAADNEERSADYADTALRPLGVPASTSTAVHALILKTQRHVTEPDDVAGQLFLDADLAILGASALEYDRYAGQIRQEYSWVPEPAYQAGRRAVLNQFLARPQIFRTAPFRERESVARRNLDCEISRLSPK